MDESRRRVVVTLATAVLTAFTVAAVAAPPDPFAQLVWFGMLLVVVLPAVAWLVYRRGYSGPDVGLLRWLFPVLAPVRLVVFLVAFVAVAFVGFRVVSAVPGGEPVALAGQVIVTFVGFVIAQWLGFHAGYDRLRRLRTNS